MGPSLSICMVIFLVIYICISEISGRGERLREYKPLNLRWMAEIIRGFNEAYPVNISSFHK